MPGLEFIEAGHLRFTGVLLHEMQTSDARVRGIRGLCWVFFVVI